LNNISENALLNIFHVYLSEMPGSGMSIYRYLDMGWRVGKKLDLYMSDERVLAVQNMCRRVLGEDHRMLGLIRFSHLMGDIYYAPVEPDFNIIALMAPHFLKRLPSQCWIIHDVKRSIAVLYNKKSWTISDFMLGERPSLEEDEKFVRSLWKEYHKCISISERLNPSLQRRNMPIRYWKYLTELSAR
jgi:probable DNA metabolism protein